jgi:hypothetical protein
MPTRGAVALAPLVPGGGPASIVCAPSQRPGGGVGWVGPVELESPHVLTTMQRSITAAVRASEGACWSLGVRITGASSHGFRPRFPSRSSLQPSHHRRLLGRPRPLRAEVLAA